MPTVTFTIDAVLNEDHSGDFPNPFPERPPDGTYEAVSVIFTGMVGEWPVSPAKIVGHHLRFSTGDAVPLLTGADKFLFQTPLWDPLPYLGGPLILFLVIDPASGTPAGYDGDLWAAAYDPDTGITTMTYTWAGDATTSFGIGAEIPASYFPGFAAGTLYGYHQPPTHWHGQFQVYWEYPDADDSGLIVDVMDMAAAVI